MLRDGVGVVRSVEYLMRFQIVVTICPIIELGSLGLACLFLQGNDSSMFALRSLRSFGDARAEEQVGRLLDIF